MALGLTACDFLEGATIASFVSVETTCDDWTMAPIPGGPTSGTFGPYTDTEDGDGNPIDPIDLEFHAEASDGVGTVLFATEPVAVFSLPTGPVGYDFDPAPVVNPIAAGFYDQRGEQFGVEFFYCDELPFQVRGLLAPGTAALGQELPVFDLIVSAPITGLDVADLELGGTAGPTGATITARSIYMSGYPSQAGFSQGENNLVRNGDEMAPDGNHLIYRVQITGVAGDGTVTMRLPAGVLTAALADYAGTNVATSTVTATVDTSGPTLSAMPDVTRQLTPSETTAAITWTDPTATDEHGVTANTCSPASGSAFSPGETSVTCTATDTLDNSSTTSFVVSVLAAQVPTVNIAPAAGGNPDQGDTATFTVSGTDYTGATTPLPAADYSVMSSVASDVIQTADGSFSVTFPHASPHVLTVTQLSTGAVGSFTVEVTPAPSAAAVTALPSSGADPVPGVAAGILLLALGFGALLVPRCARQSA